MCKWVIWKGWHFSLSNFWQRFILKIGTKPVTYKFNLPKENWFPYSDPDDLDINKLAGFSFGWHHVNSVRIGWTPEFKKEGWFTLYFYIYNEGIRTMKKFANIKSSEDYSITISFVEQLKYVSFDMTGGGLAPVKASEVFIIPSFRIGYTLWWYFGGNKTAPKEMVVNLKMN